MHSQKRQTFEDVRIEFPVLHRHLKFLYFFVISRENNSLKVLSLEETNIKHQVFFAIPLHSLLFLHQICLV